MTASYDPLLNISPESLKTGIAYARALVEADPTINLNRFLRITHWHGLDKKRGYSRCRFHSAVRAWREENGYPIRPSGRRGVSRSANWMPPLEPVPDEKAPETPEKALVPTEEGQGSGNGVSASAAPDGAALAGLVWDWMNQYDFSMVTFWDDGEVNVTRREPKEREFRIVVEGEE